MNRRALLHDAIKAEQAQVAKAASKLHEQCIRKAERAHALLAAAGRAGPIGKSIRVWMATRLERQANEGFALLRQRRQIIKASSETVEHGHRAARRQLHRDAD